MSLETRASLLTPPRIQTLPSTLDLSSTNPFQVSKAFHAGFANTFSVTHLNVAYVTINTLYVKKNVLTWDLTIFSLLIATMR